MATKHINTYCVRQSRMLWRQSKERKNGEFYKLLFYKRWPEKVSLSKDQMEVRAGICCYLGKSLEAGETTEEMP